MYGTCYYFRRFIGVQNFSKLCMYTSIIFIEVVVFRVSQNLNVTQVTYGCHWKTLNVTYEVLHVYTHYTVSHITIKIHYNLKIHSFNKFV